ncbi:hypothetical protein JKP88DRAFT_226705 [Tribonema minus]|uniref:Uncharacterized protein n=1 Tax=Tribonema minus TaxID=303371 RepID=A0A835YLA1_9STRA|nr:hypothetical protein JKP88DRAFT_226705 [Tribonema minus]
MAAFTQTLTSFLSVSARMRVAFLFLRLAFAWAGWVAALRFSSNMISSNCWLCCCNLSSIFVSRWPTSSSEF